MKLLKAKTLFAVAVSLILSFAGLAISLTNPGFLKPIQNLVFDTYQLTAPRTAEASPVVIVVVDEASINKFGQWPWPRTHMADMVRRIRDAGAASIAFDFVFSEPDRSSPNNVIRNLPEGTRGRVLLSDILADLPDHDAEFVAAISNSPVVLSFFNESFKTDTEVEAKAGISWLGEDVSAQLERFAGNVSSLASLQSAASGQGHVTLSATKSDDIVREVPLFTVQNGKTFPALSIEALRIALENSMGRQVSFVIKTTYSGSEGGDVTGASGNNASLTAAKVGDFAFPLDRYGNMTLYYARNDPTRYVSAHEVLSRDTKWLAEQFAGKIVLVGASAVGLRDIRNTTLREAVPGVAIHAQIIDQIVSGDTLQRPDWIPGAETFLAIAFALIIVLLVPVSGAIGAALIGAICAFIIIAICWIAFSRYGLLMDPTTPLAISFAAYLAMTAMMYFFAEREKRFVRNAFQHYLAPDLLARLEENPKALELGGEIREMTLMFMDVRDFTRISETLNPEQLVQFLNRLLSPLTGIIQSHEGAIDKYIGDSIMAFWNAPLDVEDHPAKACRAALEMLACVRRMNSEDAFGFHELGLGDVQIGIGINTGQGCVGNMGSSSRFDYSVIGDSVNIAARLESACKEVGWPLLVSRATAHDSPNFAFLDAGQIELKGKSHPQPVFALIGDETIATDPAFIELRNRSGSRNEKQKTTRRKLMKQLAHNRLLVSEPALFEFITR